MDIQDFVQNVKRILDERKISYSRAGKESGAGIDFIRNMDRKGSWPSTEKILQMSDYLGVSVSELLGEKKEPTPEDGSGLDAEHNELISLYDAASPVLRAAALAVLRSADGQVIEVEPVPIQTTVERVLAESGQLNRLEIRPSKVRKARLKMLSEKLEIAQNTKSGHGHE